MVTVAQDARYGVRTFLRNPGFAGVAILTLALGIGSSTAMFSVVHTILLRPLPYRDPEQLVIVWERNTGIGKMRDPVAPPNYQDWRARSTAFAQLAACRYANFALTGVDDPEQVVALTVSGNFFRALGVEPVLGRTFTEDVEAGRQPVLVLSHRFWQRRFSGDPAIVGGTISLNDTSYTVLGVMAADFRFPERATDVDVWSPLLFTPGDFRGRRAHSLIVVGRLKPAVRLAQAAEELQVIARGIAAEDPTSNPEVVVVGAHDQLVEDVRPGLLVLSAAVGFVLLIACANVASLLLVRSTSREKEIAIRTSLGARRLRIVRQLLTESLILALASVVLGLALASWMLDLAVRLAPPSVPRIDSVGIDWPILGFAVALAAATSLLFGLVPALRASRTNLTDALKQGGRRTSSPAQGRGLAALVVAEVSLSLVALAAAGLMVHSLLKLNALDYGFRPHGLLTAHVLLPTAKYPTDRHQFRPLAPDAPRPTVSRQAAFFSELMERLSALPGVESAGAVSALPLDPAGVDFDLPVVVEGQAPPRPGEEPQADFRIATPGYFRTVGIPLLRGREFTAYDGPAAPSVIIVNETFARQHFPTAEPIGQRLILYGRSREIVGLVGAVRHHGFRQEARPEMIVPADQFQFGRMTVVVRSSLDPTSLAASLKREVQAIDPSQPVHRIETMEEKLGASAAQPRFTTLVLMLFAALAVLLAVVGTYGVVSYVVVLRTHEIGIRMALGAGRSRVIAMVLRQGMGFVALGVGIGLLGAAAATRLMRGVLFQVSPTDPLTLGTVAALLAFSAFVAISIPAFRATRVDPMTALRAE
jgi:putative ABC transport system permease protein